MEQRVVDPFLKPRRTGQHHNRRLFSERPGDAVGDRQPADTVSHAHGPHAVDASISVCGKACTVLASTTNHIDFALFEQTVKSQHVIPWNSKAIGDSIIDQTIDQVLADRLVGIASFDRFRLGFRQIAIDRAQWVGHLCNPSKRRVKNLALQLHEVRSIVSRGQGLFASHLANVFGDSHRTVLRPAHAAKVRALERILRQGFIVISLGCLRVQGKTELLFPIESKTSSRQCIVSLLGARPFAGNIG